MVFRGLLICIHMTFLKSIDYTENVIPVVMRHNLVFQIFH